MKRTTIIMLIFGVANYGLSTEMLQMSNKDSAVQYLYYVMDKYHKTVDVYTEQDAGGNVYFPSGWMGDINALKYRGDCLDSPYLGLTCIKIEFIPLGNNWAGIYWQYPENNWGDEPGYDLSGATMLTFHVRGEMGGEKVEFFMAGVNQYGYTGPYRDPIQRKIPVTLDNTWQEYSIDLQGIDLQSIIGGFGFSTSAAMNRGQNVTFYLDDIQYDKKRFNEPRLLLSYEQSKFKDDYYEDAANRNAAYVHDNAVAMMTLMSDTINLESEDWTRAKLIGDALILCRDNDRYFHDGRLRNGYMTGDIIYRDTTRMPSWWDSTIEQSLENEYAVSSYTSNLAWAMIAWLWYHSHKDNPPYLTAAEELGNWIHNEMYDTLGINGYTRGFWGPDLEQIKFSSKATEDNILLYSAFKMLYKATGDLKWKNRFKYARDFVIAMWWDRDKHFWAGTQDDGKTPLTDVIPLNIHTLAFLIFKSDQILRDKFIPGINWVSDNCWVENCPNCDCTYSGYDSNGDLDGIWLGGTAQMALVYMYLNYFDKAEHILEQIRKAQKSARNANNGGIIESCHDSVSTGFYDPRNNQVYKNIRLHIGSTAWYICAEENFNPTKINLLSAFKLPATYSLLQNYPNPFNSCTTIKYQLPKTSYVQIDIFNTLGQKATNIVDERQDTGYYTVHWDGRDIRGQNVGCGVYFIRMLTEDYLKTIKILYIK